MIYAGVHEGKLFTRDTKTKHYDYAVIVADPKAGSANNERYPAGEWSAENWCGRLDLARTKAKEAGKYFKKVQIIPVFMKSATALRDMEREIEQQKKAEEEALQAAQEAARAAEMEMYVRASQDEQDETTGYDAAIDAAFDLAEIQRKEAEAREFEDAQKREAALVFNFNQFQAAQEAGQEAREYQAAQEAALIVAAEKQNQDRERAEWLAENIEEEAEEAPQEPEDLLQEAREASQAGDGAALIGAALKFIAQLPPLPKEEEEKQPEKYGPVPYAPSLICKACGKLLSGPDSIKRGYGDKCWRKVWKFVRGTQEPEAPQGVKQNNNDSITDPDTALKTRLIIKKRIDCSEETCLCGEKVEGAPVYFYDHDGGYMIPGYSQPQWIYSFCENCGHENSLRKMHTVDIEDLETEGRREAGIRLAKEEAAKAAKKAQDPEPVHYLGTGQADPGPDGMGRPGGVLSIIREELQALQDKEQAPQEARK